MNRRCTLMVLFITLEMQYSTIEASERSELYQTHYMTDFCSEPDRVILVEDSGPSSIGMLKLTESVPYRIGFNCTTVIQSPQNYSILIDITEASIRTRVSSLGCTDKLQIISGNGTYHWTISSPICGVWKKEAKSKLVYSALGYVIVKFTSDYEGINTHHTGFSMTFTAYNQSEKGICYGKDRFHCSNNACIWKPLVCDGYNNCGDMSDEATCTEKDDYKLSFGVGGSIGLGFAIILLLVILLFIVTPPMKMSRSRMTNIATVASSYRLTSPSRTCLTVDDGLPSYEEATRNNQH